MEGEDPAVKIEIDVAEEPPQSWFMTQQHTHGQAAASSDSDTWLKEEAGEGQATVSADSDTWLKKEAEEQATASADSDTWLKKEAGEEQATVSADRDTWLKKEAGEGQATVSADSDTWLMKEAGEEQAAASADSTLKTTIMEADNQPSVISQKRKRVTNPRHNLLSESEKKRRRRENQRVQKTKVISIGKQVKRWIELKKSLGLTNPSLAELLLDTYETTTYSSTTRMVHTEHDAVPHVPVSVPSKMEGEDPAVKTEVKIEIDVAEEPPVLVYNSATYPW
ncbi:hypothetical protein V1264_002721 [Littorina saxatilis]|uniref:Uncharacterized protein n=2 Tax=Littorina saxatilis TaxID=31220 RepID=A0AAN9B3W0_9CAEN